MNRLGLGLWVTAFAIGAAAGIGMYTFVYAQGGSYLTDNPAACANCHVMQEYYDAWIKSSHRQAAICNDCHTPPGLIGKYLNKAANGFNHSLAFTTGRFPDPLRIKPHNRETAEDACRRCHLDIVAAISPGHERSDRRSCLQCHSSAGHL